VGPRGLKGVKGEPGIVGGYVRTSTILTIPAGNDAGTYARCDAGDMATGGGFTTNGGSSTLDIYEVRPEESAEAPFLPSTYQVRAANNTSDDHDLQAWVVCLDITP